MVAIFTATASKDALGMLLRGAFYNTDGTLDHFDWTEVRDTVCDEYPRIKAEHDRLAEFIQDEKTRLAP